MAPLQHLCGTSPTPIKQLVSSFPAPLMHPSRTSPAPLQQLASTPPAPLHFLTHYPTTHPKTTLLNAFPLLIQFPFEQGPYKWRTEFQPISSPAPLLHRPSTSPTPPHHLPNIYPAPFPHLAITSPAPLQHLSCTSPISPSLPHHPSQNNIAKRPSSLYTAPP